MLVNKNMINTSLRNATEDKKYEQLRANDSEGKEILHKLRLDKKMFLDIKMFVSNQHRTINHNSQQMYESHIHGTKCTITCPELDG